MARLEASGRLGRLTIDEGLVGGDWKLYLVQEYCTKSLQAALMDGDLHTKRKPTHTSSPAAAAAAGGGGASSSSTQLLPTVSSGVVGAGGAVQPIMARVLAVLEDIAQGMMYIHSKNIIHGGCGGGGGVSATSQHLSRLLGFPDIQTPSRMPCLLDMHACEIHDPSFIRSVQLRLMHSCAGFDCEYAVKLPQWGMSMYAHHTLETRAQNMQGAPMSALASYTYIHHLFINSPTHYFHLLQCFAFCPCRRSDPR